MLEFARLIGTPTRRIVVQTRLGTSIDNVQAPTPDAHSVAVYIRMRHGRMTWEQRKPALGIYNCFGHVWANRRTAIYEPSEIQTILREDGYRQLPDDELPVAGDIALYQDANRGTYLHVGEVVNVPREEEIQNLRILSKWNDSCGEDYHHPRDVPPQYEPYNLQYWTDRE